MPPAPPRDELKQGPPFRSAAQEAVVALLRTASVVTRHFDAVVAREGLSFQQYNVLRILRGAGGPLPTMEIAHRLVEQTPGITRLLDRLEEKGLVERVRCGADRRRVLCTTTPAGLAVLARLDADVDRLDEATVEHLSEAERLLLTRLLAEVRRTVPCSIAIGS
jgi:DNA-binding MarR family transcriptional regulator